MTHINWDACQRTIEEDSFLMTAYMETDKSLSITKRIEAVYNQYIKPDPKNYQFYLEIKKRLEEQP